ncbi:MAG: RsiV family protein [Oscillospiraceae bacterium]|nr:RsiV family protein [Oscillospiraceae bacterium]
MNKITCILLISALLLSGCGTLESMPTPPAVTVRPTADAAETAAPETEIQAAVTAAAPAHGVLIRMEHGSTEAYDPENHSTRILSMEWDTVRVDNPGYPEAADRINEALAAMEDAWYTGNSSSGADICGYNNLLSAAEDDYGVTREYGGEIREYSAAWDVSVLRADERVCVFLVREYYYLGGAHGSFLDQALCFDTTSGERLSLDGLSENPEALKATLVNEMLKLAEADEGGYYTEHLSFVEKEDYAEAFRQLLRDGSWFAGNDAFWIFSDLYELAPYASGITEFGIPYDSLNLRYAPLPAEQVSGSLRLEELGTAAVGSTEIVDRVCVHENGLTCLLICEGRVEDLTVETGIYMENGFVPENQLYYCDYLQNSALQLELAFAGDLPDTMVRYRDAGGAKEQFISMSGLDGSLILTDNVPLAGE